MRRAALIAVLIGCAGIAQAVDIPRVPSPYRIPDRATRGDIRYRIEVTGTPWSPVSTGEQHATVRGDGGYDVRVCTRGCAGATEPAPDGAALSAALRPNSWVDSDTPAVRRFAREAAGRGPVDARMRRLVTAVQAAMARGPIGFDAYRSASQTLASPGGDCTEAAVLLAAAARAERIPVRVAFGLLYASRFTGVSHAFSPHVWVQAWDGTRWRSYDAGVGRFGAGHLLLATGDGSPTGTGRTMGLIRRLRIVDARSIVSATRPATD